MSPFLELLWCPGFCESVSRVTVASWILWIRFRSYCGVMASVNPFSELLWCSGFCESVFGVTVVSWFQWIRFRFRRYFGAVSWWWEVYPLGKRDRENDNFIQLSQLKNSIILLHLIQYFSAHIGVSALLWQNFKDKRHPESTRMCGALFSVYHTVLK